MLFQNTGTTVRCEMLRRLQPRNRVTDVHSELAWPNRRLETRAVCAHALSSTSPSLHSITGEASNQNKMFLVKLVECIGFYVYRGFWLLWSPVIVVAHTTLPFGAVQSHTNTHQVQVSSFPLASSPLDWTATLCVLCLVLAIAPLLAMSSSWPSDLPCVALSYRALPCLVLSFGIFVWNFGQPARCWRWQNPSSPGTCTRHRYATCCRPHWLVTES